MLPPLERLKKQIQGEKLKQVTPEQLKVSQRNIDVNTDALSAEELSRNSVNKFNIKDLNIKSIDAADKKKENLEAVELQKEIEKENILNNLGETEQKIRSQLGDDNKFLEWQKENEELKGLSNKSLWNRFTNGISALVTSPVGMQGTIAPMVLDNLFTGGRTKEEDAKLKLLENKQRQTLEAPLKNILEEYQKAMGGNQSGIELNGSIQAANMKEYLTKQEKLGLKPTLYPEIKNPETGAEIVKYRHANSFYEENINMIEDYLNGENNVWEGLATQKKELATIGLYGLERDSNVLAAKNRYDTNSASEADKALLKAYADTQEIEKLQLMQNRGYYKTGAGVGQSLVFVEGMALSGGLGGAVESGVANTVKTGMKQGIKSLLKKNIGTGSIRTLLKGADLTSKVTGGVAGLSAQSLITPSTGQGYLDKKLKNIELVTDENGQQKLLVGKEHVAYYNDKYDKQLFQLNEELKRVSTNPEKNKEAIDEIQSSINQLNSEKEMIKEATDEEAFAYGFTESFKEMAAERYVGKYVDKLTGYLGTSRLGKYLNTSTLGKKYNAINNVIKEGRKTFDNTIAGKISSKVMYHSGSGKIIHSLPAEMVEEIAVQATPTLGEDYSKQLEELVNPGFYADIAAQTVLMGGMVSSVGVVGNFRNFRENNTFHNSRRNIRETYDRIDRAITDDELAETIVMGTGGTGFEIGDYNYRIAKLRSEGKAEEANKLEQKKFFNLATSAMTTGTIDEFEKTLNRLSTNTNLSESTRVNAELAKTNIAEMKAVYDKYKENPNLAQIISLASQKITNKQSLRELDNELVKHAPLVQDEIEAIIKKNNLDVDFSLSNLFDRKFDDVETQEKYDKFLDVLQQENNTAVNFYADLTGAKTNLTNAHYQTMQNFNEQVHPQYIQNLEKEKELNSLYQDTLQQIENQEVFIPGAEFNYNNQLQVTDEVVDETIKKIEESYPNVYSKPFLEKLKKQQKQQIVNKKLIEKLNLLAQEQASIDEQNAEITSDELDVTEVAPIPVVDDTSEAEFASTVNDAIDNITFASEDVLFEINDDEFDDMLGEGVYTSEQLATIKANVRNSVEAIESKLGRKPTFREVMEQMHKYTPDENKVKKIFKHIVKGWQENNYTPDNYDEVYNDLFNPFEEGTSMLRDSILNMFEDTTQIDAKDEHEIIEDKAKDIEKQVAESQPVIVAYDEENMAITKTAIEEIESKRTLNVAPKLGFSALQYDEEIQNGVLVRKSKGSILNIGEDKLIDFRDLLNPDKHRTGSTLNIEVADESLWSEILVSNGRNEKGEALTTNFAEWVKGKEKSNPNFRSSQEFRNKVPMFYTDKAGTRLAYVQDTDWYNTYNVGNPFGDSNNPNIPTQEWMDHINEGKKATQNLRDNIHRGLKEVTINKSEDGVFYTIPIEQPYITINESNPQSSLAVQRGDKLFIGNQSFSAGTLLNKNSKGERGKFDLVTEDGTNQNGHTWMINRIGFTTNDKGEVVPSYRAYPILRKVTPQQIETVQWGLAAHLTLKGFTKEIKGTPYEMSIEQARKIQKDINANMNYNIENPKEITNFIKTYFQTKVQGDAIASYRALLYGNENIEDHIVQHTNSGLLGANVRSIVHIDKAMVTPLNQKYEEYLKNNLYTNIRAFDVDTTGKNPVYATVIQPIINVEYQQIAETRTSTEARQEAANQVVEEIAKETKTVNIDKHIDFLNNIGVDYSSFEDTDFMIENVDKLSNIFKIVGNLNIAQEKAIRQFIVHNIGEKVSFEYKSKVSEGKLKAEIKSDLDLVFNKLEKQIETLLTDLENADSTDTRVAAITEAYTNTLKNINDVKKNFDTIFDKAFKDIQKQTQLITNEKEDSDNNSDDVELVIKDYNKDSIEESGKSKASYRLRRFLHKIPKYDAEGNTRNTYLGLPEYMSFNDVYNELSKVLAMGSEVVSDYNLIVDKLKNSKSPFVKDILRKLEGADQQIKNEFVYNFVRHSLSSKFAMYEIDKNGTSLKIYDTNSNEAIRTIDKKWKNENRASNLYNKDLGFNSAFAERLVSQYENWDKDYSKMDQNELRNWLKELGVTFEDASWKEIYNDGIFNSQKQNSFEVLYNQDKGGLFKPIVKFLKEGINNPAKYSYDTRQNIFADLGGVMKALAMVEANHNSNLIALSFRDSGKNISTQVPTKYVTDMVQNLKRSLNEEGNTLIEELQSLSFSENSIILDLLKNEPAFKNIFELSHLGLTAIKERGDNPTKAGITDLSEIDYDLAVLTGFMDRKVDKLPDTTKINGISLRIANMMFPTMSDKTTALYLKTAVFDFMKDSSLLFEQNETTGEIKFSSELKELLFNQLALPELKRIIKFHQQVNDTNIKNYDNGAMLFHLIPKLNTLKDANGINIVEKLATLEDYKLESVLENYQSLFENAIEEVVNTEVKHKKELWEKHTEVNKQGGTYSIMFDTKYFVEVDKNPAKDYDIAVYDYVLNNLIFNSEVFKVFAGDIANYSQDKLYKEDGKKVAPFQFTQDSSYISLNKEIGVNLGKRLALLIAPGNKIANSYNEEYNQIFLEDVVDISENSAYLISSYYGEAALKKAEPILNTIRKNSEILNKHEEGTISLLPQKFNSLKTEINDSRKQLGDMFPDLDAYFDIESTDAQEYTTALEHVSVLHRMGRISEPEFKTITTKLLTSGTAGYLTKEELNLVLQPIKPVYTGTHINKDFDVNRVVYIKSSSFPLIPQLTAGTKLDALRNKMEELESTTGRFTRASFQTANKVGATKKTVNPFDVNSLNDIKEYSSNDVNSKVLVLNRNNFRIQQDVPFKSDKKQDDKVSMGTQFFKLLFGDGMIDVNDFELNGKTVTGKELYKHFNQSFKDIVDTKKQELFLDLGLSSEGTIVNEVNFIKNLQDLLTKEATGRGYSVKSLAGLKIEQLGAKAGYYYEFKTPLWLSSDSNRYESLLNSIITNRVMKHKLPGNGFIAGSESGFQFKEDLKGIDKSRIIYLDSWNGKELQGVHTINEEGAIKFNKAQIFVPSKFKNDKKELIDLFEGFNGNEGKYIIRRENGSLGLKEGMISPELLNNFTFRTPTSSHVSGSSVEIAGILPPEVGDLMIVPKNFTKQKGLDYDIDKESAYQLNHLMTKDGKIKVLEQSDIANLTKGLNDIIEKFDFENISIERKAKLFTQIQELSGGLFDEEGLEELANPQIAVKEKLARTELQLKRKLAENEFIKSHLSIFNNPNNVVQNKINKVLSIDFAKEQAEKFEKLNEEGVKNKTISNYISAGFSPLDAEKKFQEDLLNFTMLTYSYQKNKMSLGSIGKIAIGVYANYTTFNGLLQQNLDNDVYIQDEEGNAKSLQIGRYTSHGVLGQEKTLDGARTTAEVFAEKENTATDNEKEQVLGRVGVNEFTINIDAHMTLRGFDKDENGNSIPYLLLSQPIIKELNDRKKESRGILGEFIKEENIISELVDKYSDGTMKYINGEFHSTEEITDPLKTSLMNPPSGNLLQGDAMLDGIKYNGQNKLVQLAALNTYLELEVEAKAVSNIQKTINTNTLGKSMIESQLKYESLKNIYKNPIVANAHTLLGEFLETQGNREGGFWIGERYVIPNTPQGQIVINGLYLGNNLYKDFFPYQDKSILNVVKEILSVQGKENVSETTVIENFEEIVQNIKKYINSRKGNNIFNIDPRAKRYELFIDDAVNTSLSTYLKDVLNNEDKKHRKGVKSLSQNTLIKSFNYETGKGENELSLIKYNNAATDNLDEEDLYNSIPELVLMNNSLPDRNGQPYSTRQLAQDLVAYSFLEGGVQEATQFVKFVPVEYLESVGQYEKQKSYVDGELVEKNVFVPANRKLQAFNSKKNKDIDIFNIALGVKGEATSTFAKQYFQHNPAKAPRISKPKSLGNGVISYVDAAGKSPAFVSLKNKKDAVEKYTLYEHIGNGTYHKVNTLGNMGISEYEYRNENVVALNNDKINIAPTVAIDAKPLGTTGLNIDEKTSFVDILKQISIVPLDDKYKHLNEAAKWLLPMVKNQGKLILDETLAGAGRAGKSTLNITLNPNMTLNLSDEATAMTFVHEMIHTLSRNELDQYFNEEGTALRTDIGIPSYVTNLFVIYNEFKTKMQPELDNLELKMTGKLDPALGGTEYTEREKGLVYGAKNIREFLAVALTSPLFQEEMNKVEYKKSGESVFERFKKIILDILANVYPSLKTDSVAKESILSSMNFIQEEYNMRRENESQELLPNDIQYQLEMDDSNALMYGALDTSRQVDNLNREAQKESNEDNMIENSLFQEDILNLPDCI